MGTMIEIARPDGGTTKGYLGQPAKGGRGLS
jgi:hypothetical protein